jgi:hypothetical protein
METVYAEGFMYRKASKEPRKPIVVVGMWLLMIPFLAGGLGFVFAGLSAIGGRESIFLSLLAMAFGAGILWIPFTLLSRTMTNYQAKADGDAESDDELDGDEQDGDDELGESDDDDENAVERDPAEHDHVEEDDGDGSWRIDGYGTDAEERAERAGEVERPDDDEPRKS